MTDTLACARGRPAQYRRGNCLHTRPPARMYVGPARWAGGAGRSVPLQLWGFICGDGIGPAHGCIHRAAARGSACMKHTYLHILTGSPHTRADGGLPPRPLQSSCTVLLTCRVRSAETVEPRPGPKSAAPPFVARLLRQCEWQLVVGYSAAPPMQPAHRKSIKSPPRSANAAAAGALGHRMEHSSDIHHANTLTPQPRAETLTCSHHLPANLPNAEIERHGETVKVRSGHKDSASKRC